MQQVSLNSRIAAIDQQRLYGNLNNARQQAEELLIDYPDHPYAHNLIALIEHQLGNSQKAIAILESVVHEHSSLFLPIYNLGVIATDCNNFSLADHSLNVALGFNEHQDNVLRELERLYLKSQNLYSLVRVYLQLLQSGKLEKKDRGNFYICLENTIVKSYIPALESEIINYIDNPDLDPEGIRNCIIAQISDKYIDVINRIEDGIDSSVIDILSSDVFLRRLLGELIFCDPRLEVFLKAIRRYLLSQALEKGDVPDGWLGLIEAISSQCWLNEYVFNVDEDEQLVVSQLIENIEAYCSQDKVEPQNISTTLLLVAMYADPDALLCRDNLLCVRESEWPKYIRPLFNRLRAQKKRRQLSDEMPYLLPVQDGISQKVRAQYEENPYPRWLRCARISQNTFGDWLKEIVPDYDPPAALFGKSFDLLIAGCGTGKQAAQIARSFPQAKILAVDLSTASLAYARHKALQYNLKNIDFLQADILDLVQLPKRFDVVLCTGVLHHMSAIEPGWKILSGLLKDGGIMQIALYSRLARQGISEIRNIVAEYDIPPTLEGIRAIREMIFSGQLPDLSNSSDFYSTSNCRDLLFHVQEIQSDIPDLIRMLNELELGFIGFDLLRILPDLFKEIKGDSSLRVLENWQNFEEHHPSVFEAMYTFWCNKKVNIKSCGHDN